MFSKFFIERPRLSAVISIILIILGILAIQVLPVNQYPALTPPQIVVSAVYPGADAETVIKTVITPLEEAINGSPNMIYMTSSADSSGSASINVYFEVGTDVNVAKMDVNNRVQTALNRLPEEVRRQGITVRERSPDIAIVVTFFSEGSKRSVVDLSNYILINVVEDLKRIPGVGDVIIFDDKSYSIRVWLEPDKLAKYELTPLDIFNVINSQNQQFSAGSIAEEPIDRFTYFSYTVKGEPRLETVSQFENILIRSNPDGSALRLKDVAKIELSSENFNRNSFYKGHLAIPVGVFLAPGANLLEVVSNIKKTLNEISKNFPPDIKYAYPYDPSIFVKESIKEVIVTFIIAIILVVFVIYLFLGSLRSTIIPVLAIPVSIIGTFAFLYAFNFSINLLTLFGLILAIGLVVDDAIIVIENAERIMRTYKLSPKEATIRAMEEITSPIIAIVLVLSAVFIPAGFTGGFTGVFYQQFAITIAFSMILSGLVALTLTPALCAIFLEGKERKVILPVRVFQNFFLKTRKSFVRVARLVIKFAPLGIIVSLLVIIFTVVLVRKLPTSLVPMEDQGIFIIFSNLPPGASLKRTSDYVNNKIEERLFKIPEVREWVAIAGLDLQSFGYKTDSATAFVMLKDWKERKEKEKSVFSLVQRLNQDFYKDREALTFVVNPPPIRGMSLTGGFELYIQDRKGGSVYDLYKYTQELINEASKRPELTAVRTTFIPNVPTYKVIVDREKAKAYNVEISDVYRTLAMIFGKYYVNDFNLYGRVFHVNMEAESRFRDDLGDYRFIYVRSKTGELIPVSSLIKIERVADPSIIEKFNMFPSAKVLGQANLGYSSGDAIKAISEVAKKVLPSGYTIAWSGTSYQEIKVKGKTGKVLFYAIIFVYLILVALYESWSAPLAIMLSVPFAIFGASLGMYLLGLENDIYFQAGLLVLIGLSAKNAILIVEFAEERLKRGMPLLSATLEAAELRYRPIIMTSFAFIAGALPLMFAKGAGANSREVIGTTVVTGMLFATVFGIFFIPLFYYLIVKIREKIKPSGVLKGLSLIFVFLFFHSCSLAPEYKKPEIPLPENLKIEEKISENTTKVDAIYVKWWENFGDPFLNKLIEEALKNNDDLKIYVARVEQALANLRFSKAELYPEITYSISAKRERYSEEMYEFMAGTENIFNLSATVSYELDLWKRLRNEERASFSRFLAARAERDAFQISLISNVATLYFDLIAVEKKLRIAENFLEVQKNIYEFRKKQYQNGLVDELVVEQAKAEYEATRLKVEDLRNQKENLKTSLSLLIGRNPREIFEKEVTIAGDLPKPLPIPSALPSTILQKRPDIIAAEERLKAVNFEIGVARSAYFPLISLTGAYGFESMELSNLIKHSASVWNLGAIITGTILDFGRTKSMVELKEAEKKEALYNYVKTVKTAFKEVYDALANLSSTYKKLSSQQNQVNTLEKVLNLSEKKFEKGLTDHLTVLIAQRDYLNSQLNLISLKAELLKNYVYLYKALGGGWQQF
jgi:HAE1 family hydrophobic/amphiphilic exporter-1/multidrug efflux pump